MEALGQGDFDGPAAILGGSLSHLGGLLKTRG